MKAISLLIKPASGLCNLTCEYCFYRDEMANRNIKSYGLMTTDLFEKIIESFFTADVNYITIAFQGGEPLLRGIDFYKKAIEIVKRYNKTNINVIYTIQTNATLIDDEWIAFFKENSFLVGISLDGIKKVHDKYRNNTYNKVYEVIAKLKEANIAFNILTVVTKDVVKNIKEIYSFYKENHLDFQQYIPLMEPLNEEKGDNSYSLTKELYEEFLNELFKLYYNDITNGIYVYNRFFENIIGIILNKAPEACSMLGRCSIQYVVEANGNVYPCDFYCVDKYLLGNIKANTLMEIDNKRTEIRFIEESLIINKKCKACKYYKLCRTGCKRDKTGDGLNYYCDAFYNFFDNNINKLEELVSLIYKGKFPIPKI